MLSQDASFQCVMESNGVNGTNGTNGVNGINGLNGHHSHSDGADGPSSTFEPSIFRSYMLALLPALFGCLPDDLVYLFDEHFEDRIGRFASEGNAVIYVSKIKDEAEGTSTNVGLYGRRLTRGQMTRNPRIVIRWQRISTTPPHKS